MDLENLPQLYRRVAPEMFEDPSRWPDETRATCDACPMLVQPGEEQPPRRRVFERQQRCCSYHPGLTNWQVGRILNRGGLGAEKMLARMEHADGIDAFGVAVELFAQRAYALRAREGFGSMDLRCPYWVDGPMSCTIWPDRNSVCRTWHCKTVDGRLGQNVWNATRAMLATLEGVTSDWLVEVGPPRPKGFCLARNEDEALPALDDMIEAIRASYDKSAWIAWFTWCADRIEQLTDAEVTELRERADVRGHLIWLRTAIANRGQRMPDIPQVSLAHWDHQGDRVALMPWSEFDPLYAPPWIFTLLSKLDGLTPWRDAVAATEAEVGEKLDPTFLTDLWRAGGLSWPDPRDREAGPGVHAHLIPIPEP